MGGKSDPPPPPDYRPIAAASAKSARYAFKLGQEQLDWAKQVYAKDSNLTDQVVNSFLTSESENQANAEKDRARYEGQFQPLEDQLVQDASTYASPERKAQAVGAAQAGVAQQYDQARTAAQQELESYGINPSATRYAALDSGLRANQAAAAAAAGTNASNTVDTTARALRDQAINIGKGYPTQVTAEYGTSGQAGNSAVGNQLATTASGASTMGTAPQYQALGNQALGVWGNTLNEGYQNALSAWQAQNSQSSGIGGILGTAAGIGLKLAGLKDGGTVPGYADGGAIPMDASPSRGAIPDDVPAEVDGGPPARLTAGEFVMPRDATEWIGERQLQKMIEKARQEKHGAAAHARAIPAVVPPAAMQRPAQPQAALPAR